MNATASLPLRAGSLSIDPVRRRIAGPGGEVALEPMVMQLLLHLVEREGQVLPRRDLFDHLWGNAQVGDDSLNRLVGSLRKAIERTGGDNVEIETVPRTGYRLIASSGADDNTRPVTRRTIIAGSASLLLAAGGAGLWQVRRETRSFEVERLIDRGDVLLHDAAPPQADEALPPLRSALALDPNNVEALGLLALAEETRASTGGSDNPGETLRAADAAAQAALQRDPHEPHARLAMIDMTAASLDWAGLEDRLEALHALVPTNLHVLGSLANFLQAAGRTSRSWFYNEQVASAAPASPTPQWRRALRLWTAGRNEEALSLTERLLPLWPRHSFVWNARFMILAFTGRTGAAAAMLRDPLRLPRNAHPATPEQWLPSLEALADPSRARVARAKEVNLGAAQLNPGQATWAAMILSQLGELDAAFEVINALLLSKGPLVAKRPICRATLPPIRPAGAAPSGCSCLRSQPSVTTLASKPCARTSDWRAIGGSKGSSRIQGSPAKRKSIRSASNSRPVRQKSPQRRRSPRRL